MTKVTTENPNGWKARWADSAEAAGHAGRHGRRGPVPGLAAGGLHGRPDPDGRWRADSVGFRASRAKVRNPTRFAGYICSAMEGVTAMDKDRIVGSAKDFAGKVESTVGDLAGDARTEASGRAREAAGTVQNLYGQAKDAARDAADTAMIRQGRLRNRRNAARRAGGDYQDGAGKSAGVAAGRRRYRLCARAVADTASAPSAAVTLAVPLSADHSPSSRSPAQHIGLRDALQSRGPISRL